MRNDAPNDDKTVADAARISPATVFEKPEDVIQDDDLTRAQKEKILDQWQADAEALQTATDEGMPEPPAGEADAELDDVNAARSKIEGGNAGK